MTARRVGVVGGGLAGMAASLRAADAGAQVVLFERRSALGGLTSSIERNGLTFDNGQHVFMRCCTSYRDFLARVGATDRVRLQTRLEVPVLAPGGARATIRRHRLPAPLHLAPSLLRYRHISARERLRLARAVFALRRLDPGDRSLDATGFGPWLAAHGQSPRAVDHLWDLIARPTLNVGADQASLAAATMVFRVGLLDRADAGDIGWSKVPLAELHGSVPARALDAAGVQTLLNTPVSAIERTSNGVSVVAEGRALEFDAVIVATPARVAATLGAVGPGVAEGLGASPIVNVHLVLDRRVTELEFAAAVDSPIEFLFDRSASSGAAPGQQCLAISLSAADRYIGRPTHELVDEFLEALRDLLPAARGARLVDSFVTRERAATFRAVPGAGALRPPSATSVPGVFLAGAWCDTGWPATMEGAVRSGNEAAAAALGLAIDIGARARQPERIDS